jgi:hypothetical protein
MLIFNVCPFEGAAPITFGLPRATVLEILGAPAVAGKGYDIWGSRGEINVGYDRDGAVIHVGLGPGAFELRLNGELIWGPSSHADPNIILLRLDPEPLERVGFLVFPELGIATAGFHDDDPSQYAFTVFPRGEWDDRLTRAQRPDLTKYRGMRPERE